MSVVAPTGVNSERCSGQQMTREGNRRGLGDAVSLSSLVALRFSKKQKNISWIAQSVENEGIGSF
jgi:hypothetical protein